jgi:hypothetical protein
MSITLQIFFALAAIYAVVVIVSSVRKALRHRRQIRQQLANLSRRQSVMTASDKERWNVCRHEHEWLEHWQFGADHPDRIICRICGIDKPEVTSHGVPASRIDVYRDLARSLGTRKLADYADNDAIESQTDGEPLPHPPAPNIGGVGHPDYEGDNYVEPEEITDEMKRTIYFDTPDGEEFQGTPDIYTGRGRPPFPFKD